MKARLAALLVLVPSIALAHPGHGTAEPDTLAHYLTEPLHLGVLVLALATLAVAIGWHGARRKPPTRTGE